MTPRVEKNACPLPSASKAGRGLRTNIFHAAVLAFSCAVLAPFANSQSCVDAFLDGDAVPCAIAGNFADKSESQTLGANAEDYSIAAGNPQASPTISRNGTKDLNRDIFYGGKLEFALDAGWLPVNVPFPFDFIEGDPYDLYPLRYTLVPVIGSLRWHFTDVHGPWFLRGDWDTTFSLSATAIPKGAETHYVSYDMGVRRNFVPRNWRVTPYGDVRCGVGIINAKGPLGVYYAQGQNMTFNLNMGAGARYNFNSRYAISAGLNWMHISNANSSSGYSNYGINVYGPMLGLDIRLRRPRHSEQ